MNRILVIEDTESLRNVLCSVLEVEGFEVCGVGSAEEGIDKLSSDEYSVVLTDLKLPELSGLDFVKLSNERDRSLPVVVMTAYGSIDLAVEAIQLGAQDFITKPFDPDELCRTLQSVSEQASKNRKLSRAIRAPSEIVAQSTSMLSVLAQARKVAQTDTPVLLLGESGVGKEVLARFIHLHSNRCHENYLAVNCASQPQETLESEFFGHEVGAFTGASERRLGLFEAASQGTLFLDEIGNMPYALQVKLLRALQESEVKRLGSNKVIPVNTRVISATNADLDALVAHGEFREDLYYRLGVFVLKIPALRERREDIEPLTHMLIASLSSYFEEETREISSEAISTLKKHSWPGNIRELENVLERAMIFNNGRIEAEHLEFATEDKISEFDLLEISSDAAKQAEIDTISHVLALVDGNKSKAAKALNVSYKTLLNKIKAYKIS